jgi:aspartate kinase
MALIVQKYGGTSVGSTERIQKIADKIIETKRQGHDVVVVVSAMSGETNRLISLAQALTDQPDPREYDALLATGEQVATALLAIALLAKNYSARSYNSFHIPFYTDSCHKKARILNIETTLIRQDLEAGRIPIIAGFQGVSEEGHLTTLGRGGSDTTAAALAAILEAKECQIYTDVDGIYTADPRVVAQAKRLNEIGFSEMTEFARAGAKVVQHRAVELASKFAMPLRVLSSFENKAVGTLIQANQSGLECAKVLGVSASQQEAKITIQGLKCDKKTFTEFFALLKTTGIEIDMLTQQLTSKTHMDITFTLAKTELQPATEIFQNLVHHGEAKSILSDTAIAKLSVIGTGLHSHSEIIHTLFQVLQAEEIAIQLLFSSALRISLVINKEHVARAIQVLHDAFGLSDG